MSAPTITTDPTTTSNGAEVRQTGAFDASKLPDRQVDELCKYFAAKSPNVTKEQKTQMRSSSREVRRDGLTAFVTAQTRKGLERQAMFMAALRPAIPPAANADESQARREVALEVRTLSDVEVNFRAAELLTKGGLLDTEWALLRSLDPGYRRAGLVLVRVRRELPAMQMLWAIEAERKARVDDEAKRLRLMQEVAEVAAADRLVKLCRLGPVINRDPVVVVRASGRDFADRVESKRRALVRRACDHDLRTALQLKLAAEDTSLAELVFTPIAKAGFHRSAEIEKAVRRARAILDKLIEATSAGK